MNLKTLKEFVRLEDEIAIIAEAIVQEHYKETDSSLRYHADNVDFTPFDQGSVSINIYVSGRHGYTDHAIIHVTTEKFCDPKYLLDSK